VGAHHGFDPVGAGDVTDNSDQQNSEANIHCDTLCTMVHCTSTCGIETTVPDTFDFSVPDTHGTVVIATSFRTTTKQRCHITACNSLRFKASACYRGSRQVQVKPLRSQDAVSAGIAVQSRLLLGTCDYDSAIRPDTFSCPLSSRRASSPRKNRRLSKSQQFASTRGSSANACT
jgi:hypothetical protein